MIVVISGLPGTGKSAVAVAAAEHLLAVHVSIDPVEDAMLGAGLPSGWTTAVAAYEAVRVVAEMNLALGCSVVVDAVNDSELGVPDVANCCTEHGSAAQVRPVDRDGYG